MAGRSQDFRFGEFEDAGEFAALGGVRCALIAEVGIDSSAGDVAERGDVTRSDAAGIQFPAQPLAEG